MKSAGSTIRTAKNCVGFKEAIDKLEPKAKGDAFELLTRLYLQLEPKYATKLSDVWHLGDVPAVRAHLNRPSKLLRAKRGYWCPDVRFCFLFQYCQWFNLKAGIAPRVRGATKAPP